MRLIADLLLTKSLCFLMPIAGHYCDRVVVTSALSYCSSNAGGRRTRATLTSRRLQRYRARVAYDGHGFAGFQLQHKRNNNNNNKQQQRNNNWNDDGVRVRTVQGVLEEVLQRRLLGSIDPDEDEADEDEAGQQQRMIKVVAAGRTDAGVHARGQAIHFDVPADEVLDDYAFVCHSLNRMLPPDIRIWNLQRAPGPVVKQVPKVQSLLEGSKGDNDVKDNEGSGLDDDDGDGGRTVEYDWNVLYDSTGKLYCYRLSLAPVMDPLDRYSRWHPPNPKQIDISKLPQILHLYEGTHDFRAFAGSVEQTEKTNRHPLNTVRTVYSVKLVREDGGDGYNYRIDMHLKGALYKQVRSMVGTALDVCRGRLSEDEFRALLFLPNNHNTTRAHNRSKPAPPEGLTLEQVYFDNDPEF